jgi:hypothetical protein
LSHPTWQKKCVGEQTRKSKIVSAAIAVCPPFFFLGVLDLGGSVYFLGLGNKQGK